MPVPEGLTIADIETVWRSWSVNGEPAGHLDIYLDDSLWRFLHTWGLAREGGSGRCLELGANPYFTTYLLDQYTELDLTLANFFANECERIRDDVRYTTSDGRPCLLTYESVLFNVEEDKFPFDSDSFEVVLFCEMIEHLLMDPLAALREIHRVLKPGGILVLTTPNSCRLQNVVSMVNGVNIYDPYSGFGPYGRHNREYTRHELHRLLEFAGFDVDCSFTADGAPQALQDWPYREEVEELVSWRVDDLGQYLFIRASAARTPRDLWPNFLYRSRPAGELIEYC